MRGGNKSKVSRWVEGRGRVGGQKMSEMESQKWGRLGHYGEGCPNAEPGRSFTLVERNGIHATAIAFCGCKTVTAADGQKVARSHFEQLLEAGIFPGSIKDPGTGYTLGLLQYHRQQRSQGKGSAYNFVLVLQRLADPNFANRDIYKNFLAITRFYENIQIIIESGEGHGLDIPLAGEVGRPYPNRPKGFLGLVCAMCPEPGVNMPLLVHMPPYLQHLTSLFQSLDGNYKACLFFKRDNGSDTALTDGNMYFAKQAEFELFLKTYVIPEEDKEVPCKAHIGTIRHQGLPKYGNTAVSGVVGCACDHAVLGFFIDMVKGEAFALGTYAQWEHLRHKNTPPLSAESQVPMVQSYDSYCSFVVNQTKRGVDLFPEEMWFHDVLKRMKGQIPADHICGHGIDCQALWQAIYFACRAHFHGETAEVIWAFLNGLGSSTRQMTGGSRHDIINFVMHAWNLIKYLRHDKSASDSAHLDMKLTQSSAAELLSAKRLDALQLFELHMAVVEELSRQHATEVVGSPAASISTSPRKNLALTVESTLAAMITVEQEKLKRDGQHEAGTSVAQWIHDGMAIECQHALDVDEPEISAIQLPSYRMKHRQRRPTTGRDDDKPESELRDTEIELRCTEAQSAILAIRDASLVLSAVRKARDLDFRGQVGITRSKRNLQKAELMKTFEIGMYNSSRMALIHLGHMEKDAVEPFPPLSYRDTRKKETHLSHATGDSRLFDGTAWYLQSGVTITNAATTSILSPRTGSVLSPRKGESESDEPELLAGTQSRKRTGFKCDPRTPKRLRDIAPEGVGVESSAEESGVEMLPSKGGKAPEGKKGKTKERGKKKPDGWIWMEILMRGQHQSEEKLAAYKKESDQVQWFRAEAEMYRWLEQYERKHTEFLRVIERYRRCGRVTWLACRQDPSHAFQAKPILIDKIIYYFISSSAYTLLTISPL
ncbi:hypothetical protein B0H14DRAFT_2597646 [Mycena olivaceomarginata]|nr:hypothetical protein B0H14DRAFT_2597646 [Mycena olivaceomarginata]